MSKTATTLTVTAETGTVYTVRAYANAKGRRFIEIMTPGCYPMGYSVDGLLEQPHPHRGMLDPMGNLIDGPAVDLIRDWLFES